MIKLGRKHITLLLVVCATIVIQPSLAVRAAGPYRMMVPIARGPAGTASMPTTRYTALELETVDKINERRRAAGCTPVTLNSQLSAAAERHSKDMVTKNFFSHTGSDGSSFDQRIRDAGYTPSRQLGEILAAGYSTADTVVQGWYDSPGHRAIMLDCQYKNSTNPEFREIGIALEIKDGTQYRYYWTATFGVK